MPTADFYLLALPLLFGFVLDLIIGDPYKLPHPIRLFGNVISFTEKRINKGKGRFLKGAFVTIVLVLTTWLVFKQLLNFAQVNAQVYYVVASILVFYGLANRNLIQEALKVEKALSKQGLEEGRKQVSFIVGRDTSKLSEKQIRLATLETLAENLSDGVIAPMFYYAVGGIPLMFAYKMINTLDSMIGYTSERYKHFGHFAAKLDDVANYIPARITALLIALVGFKLRAFQFILKFGNKHASPNAGYPEAALAGVLNCRFGGPNRYHGKLVDKPFIGDSDRDVFAKDIKKACWINIKASLLFMIFLLKFFYIAFLIQL